MEKIDGKIILIDEAAFEKALLELNLHRLGWDIAVEYFNNTRDAFNYLIETRDELFLVICAMKFQDMSGIQFKKELDNNKELKRKIIPFIFMSNSANIEEVYSAYECIQGYFKKPYSVDTMAKMLDIIIKYWMICKHPDNIEKMFERGLQD